MTSSYSRWPYSRNGAVIPDVAGISEPMTELPRAHQSEDIILCGFPPFMPTAPPNASAELSGAIHSAINKFRGKEK